VGVLSEMPVEIIVLVVCGEGSVGACVVGRARFWVVGGGVAGQGWCLLFWISAYFGLSVGVQRCV